MNYEHRIVCFPDIPGFKGLVNGTVNKEYDDNGEETESFNNIPNNGIMDHTLCKCYLKFK